MKNRNTLFFFICVSFLTFFQPNQAISAPFGRKIIKFVTKVMPVAVFAATIRECFFPTQGTEKKIAKSIAVTFSAVTTAVLYCDLLESGTVRIIENYKMRKHKAPGHVQKQAEKFFDAMHKNDNFYKRILAWCKKKLGYITVYQGVNDKWIRGLEANAFYQKGIFFLSNSFSEKKIDPLQNATLCHEVAHAWQDSLIFEPLWTSDKKTYKTEYEAEKIKMKNLYELHMEEELLESLFDRIDAKIKMAVGELDLEFHPYVYGTIDGFFDIFCSKTAPEIWIGKDKRNKLESWFATKEKNLPDLLRIWLEVEKGLLETMHDCFEQIYSNNPELLSEAKKACTKFFLEIKNWQATSWEKRYKSYCLTLENQKKKLVTNLQENPLSA